MIKHIAILFFILALLPVALAAPPFIQTSQAGTYQIRVPSKFVFQQSQNYTFDFHVFNSTGAPLTSGIGCYFHMYDVKGNHLAEIYDATASSKFDYEIFINSNNFSNVGLQFYHFQCNSTLAGGYETVQILVTPSGDSDEVPLPQVIVLLTIAGLFILSAQVFDSRRWLIKIALVFASLLMIFITINLIFNISASKLQYASFINSMLLISVTIAIVFIGIIITYFKDIIRAVKDSNKAKKEEI